MTNLPLVVWFFAFVCLRNIDGFRTSVYHVMQERAKPTNLIQSKLSCARACAQYSHSCTEWYYNLEEDTCNIQNQMVRIYFYFFLMLSYLLYFLLIYTKNERVFNDTLSMKIASTRTLSRAHTHTVCMCIYVYTHIYIYIYIYIYQWRSKVPKSGGGHTDT